MRNEYQQDGVRLLIRPIDQLKNKHVDQLILTGPSHAARKEFTSTDETVVGRRW